MASKTRKISSYAFLDILLPWGGYFLIHFLIKNVFQQDVYELFSVIVIPIVVCLIRVGATNIILGQGQINVLPKNKRVLFQVFLALSLIVLMIFEFMATLLNFAENVPIIAWGICIGLYCLYLFFMFLSEKMYHNNSNGTIVSEQLSLSLRTR
jgi:hypothetical protein